MLLFNDVKEPVKVVSVSLPQSLLDEIDKRRSVYGFSRSVYLRLAVHDYFRKEDNRQK